jgi:hypothetical protein
MKRDFVVLMALGLAGCGGDSNRARLVQVTGKVTLDRVEPFVWARPGDRDLRRALPLPRHPRDGGALLHGAVHGNDLVIRPPAIRPAIL